MHARRLLIGGLFPFLSLVVSSRSVRSATPDEYLADPPASAGLQVGVQVRVARDSLGRSAARGVLTLTVPLDRLAASAGHPQARGLPPSAAPVAEGAAHPGSPDPARVVPVEGVAPPRSSRAEDRGRLASGAPERGFGQLRPTLDPDLCRRTVQVAVQAAGFGASARRLSSLSGRARTSAALPELRLRGGRATDESLRLTPTSSDPYRYTEAGQSELFFEVRMTWKLDRLVFSEAELRVERLRRERAKAEARLVEQVLRLLFARERARTRLAVAPLLPEERAVAVLEQLEAEAMLDVYTAGWFSHHVSAGPADGSKSTPSTRLEPP